jgi:PAS domain S-box-containing protein
VNQQYDIEYVNPAVVDTFGPVEGRKCYAYFKDQPEPCSDCKNKETFAGGSVRSEWYSSKTNRHYDFFGMSFQNEDGSISRLGVLNDITERKKAEVELRVSQERFQLAMDATADGLWDWNVQSGTIYYSPAWGRIIGYEELKPVFSTWKSRLHPEDKPLVLASLQAHLDGETAVWRNEHRLVTSDGSWKWVAGRGRVVARNEDGKALRMIGTIADISERKKTEDILGKYTKQLRLLSSKISRAEDQERRRIAENIHDNVIQPMVFLDIIVQSLPQMSGDAERKRTYKEIRKTLCELIDHSRSLIFDLSNPVLYELGLEQAIGEYLHLEVEKKHQIKTNFQCDLQDLKLDHAVLTLIYKSIKELLVNVIKHAHADTVNVSIVRNHTMIDVYVEDNGCGFKTNKKSLTSGFGLFNIWEKVLHCGGWFDIDSKTGLGSRITFSVPLKQGYKEKRINNVHKHLIG